MYLEIVAVGEESGKELSFSDMQTTEEFIVRKAIITNLTDEAVPASTLRLETKSGITLSCTFGELNPQSSDEDIIEGSVATTSFTKAKLLVAATVSMAFESEFGTAPAPPLTAAADGGG